MMRLELCTSVKSLDQTRILLFSVVYFFVGITEVSARLADAQLKNWALKADSTGVSQAWNTTQGSRSITVAVIDTGIDPEHPSLKNVLWKSPSDSSVYGFDFARKYESPLQAEKLGNTNPKDTNGHGTHIAGIIAGAENLAVGTAGVAPNVRIMPVKYYVAGEGKGAINLANSIKSLQVAIDNGAKIINYSGGGPEYSEEEFQAIKRAQDKGVLIVAAAGNDGRNTDEERNRYYPASYKLKGLTNIITVASVNASKKLLSSSNYGLKSVDIAAPGESIISTLPDRRYGNLTGTSQATAIVTGAAALLLSKHPHLTPEQIKKALMTTASPSEHLVSKVGSGGVLNIKKALELPVGRSTASDLKTVSP